MAGAPTAVALIRVHPRLKILACELATARALAASQSAKNFEPQMNTDERGWPRSRYCRPVRVGRQVGRCRPPGRFPARKDRRAEPATGARNAKFVQGPYEAGRGPARPEWSEAAPDGAARGRGRARNAIFARRCHATWSGPAPPGRPSPDRTARLAGAVGHGMRFRAATQCNGERASSAGLAGPDPDGTAGGCGGARNAIFARRCHATWSGPALPGWPGFGPGWRGWRLCGARNTKFAQGPSGQAPEGRPYGTGNGPRGRGWSGFGREARPAVVAGNGMRFLCKDPRVKRPRACLMDPGAGLGPLPYSLA